MKRNPYYIFSLKFAVILLITAMLVSSCQDQADREEAILLELRKKREEHFNYRFDACRQLLVKDVEAHVDSVIYLEIILGLHGDVEIPARPDRAGDTLDYDIILDTTKLDVKDLEKLISR